MSKLIVFGRVSRETKGSFVNGIDTKDAGATLQEPAASMVLGSCTHLVFCAARKAGEIGPKMLHRGQSEFSLRVQSDLTMDWRGGI